MWVAASLGACAVVMKLPSGLGRSLGQGIGTERQVPRVASHPTIPPPQVWEAETHTSGTPSTILESRDSCPHLTDEDPDSDLPKVT